MLRELTNAYVTTGKAIRKRPGLTKIATLEAGTVGLSAADGKLNTFYDTGSITHANPLFQANILPRHAGEALQGVVAAEMFNGQLFVLGEYTTRNIASYNGAEITDVNFPGKCNHIIKAAEKIFATDQGSDVVRFSSTGNPMDWTTAQDAGFLPTGLRSDGSVKPTGLGQYLGRLVVLHSDHTQVWTVDPDPAKMALFQGVSGVGTTRPLATSNVANDVVILDRTGIRSITMQLYTANLIDLDIGSPIDSLIKAETGNAIGLFWHGGGQYWVVFGSNVYVYTFSRTANIAAWSKYVYGFSIQWMTELDGLLYLRSGDNVYLCDDTVFKDDAASFKARVVMPYLDMKSPGVLKQFMGMDAVINGKARIKFQYYRAGFPLAKYWRFNISKKHGTIASIIEVELRGSPGGADQSNGGTPSASSEVVGYKSAKAFDNNSSTLWRSQDGQQSWWLEYEFPSPVIVREYQLSVPVFAIYSNGIAMFFPSAAISTPTGVVQINNMVVDNRMALGGSGSQIDISGSSGAPEDWELEYSYDGVTWFVADAISGKSFASNQTQLFSTPVPIPSGAVQLVDIPNGAVQLVDIETNNLIISGDTRPGGVVPVDLLATGIAPVLENDYDEAWQMDELTFYYENLGVV